MFTIISMKPFRLSKYDTAHSLYNMLNFTNVCNNLEYQFNGDVNSIAISFVENVMF